MSSRPPAPEIAADSLALAVILASPGPVLLLDAAMHVVAISDSFCRVYGVTANEAVGTPVYALGAGGWDTPQLRSLLQATAAGDAHIEAYEFDLVMPGEPVRRLVLSAGKLNYASDIARLLLTVTDVTELRANHALKEQMVHDKLMMLQEVQHRVANSLQIIASVLLLNARRLQAGETRGHLQDAHDRVIAVAEVQRHLAITGLNDVDLRVYLNQLCDSLGASMIRDHKRLNIEIRADDTHVSPDVSVSIGLIVTELVINTLKHAFKGPKMGTILVEYRSGAEGWILSVSDDGVGMPVGGETRTGLGTNIVQALAKQLQARIEITGANPGTRVALIHERPV